MTGVLGEISGKGSYQQPDPYRKALVTTSPRTYTTPGDTIASRIALSPEIAVWSRRGRGVRVIRAEKYPLNLNRIIPAEEVAQMAWDWSHLIGVILCPKGE